MSVAMQDIPAAVELQELFAKPPREPAPAPGIYFDVPMQTYLMWDALSSGVLIESKRSPAHAHALIEEAPSVSNDDTLPTIIGTAAHCAVLEPKEFEKRYLRGPLGNWSHKIPKDAVAEMRRLNPGCAVLKPYKYDAVLQARDTILADPDAAPLLSQASSTEVSIVWDDSETGIRCKARPDFLIPEWGTVGDLKSTIDASRRGFSRAIANFSYHNKAAWYLDGMNVLGAGPLEYDSFAFIAFEKEGITAVSVYQLEDADIETGRQQNRTLIRRWNECLLKDSWPAYPKGISFISMPEWAHMVEV